MNCIKGALGAHTPIHDHEADHPIIAGRRMTTQLETMRPLHCTVWAVSMSSELSRQV